MRKPYAARAPAFTRANVGDWRFDEIVAARFDAEARLHIPRYEAVIQKCVDIACAAFPDRRASIIDVGSATGYTMKRLLAAGFTDVHGVENSLPMIRQSGLEERVIHSASFPVARGPYQMVLMNWTLHFIADPGSYLADVRQSLSPGGILIVSDKMTAPSFLHDRYHDFKRSQGVSPDEIRRKEEALRGILRPHPLAWYLETLPSLGFKDVSVIDADFCFATVLVFA